MIWDVRVWSFFVWLVATALYVVGFATPFPMYGNNEPVQVGFGGGIAPEMPRIGLWGSVPDEYQGFMTAVRAVLSMALITIVISMIGYFLLCKMSNTIVQIVSFVAQIVSGVLGLIGIGIYRANSDQLGEGFWFISMSSVIYVMNGVVLIFMPWMEYQVPKWKTDEDVPLTSSKA